MEKSLKASQSARKGLIKRYKFKSDINSLFNYKYHSMVFIEQEKSNRILTDYEKSLIYKICELQIYMIILKK